MSQTITPITAARTAHTPPNGRALEHSRRMIREAIDELGHEDAKAARLLAAMSVAATALTTGTFAGDWRPTHLGDTALTLWAIGTAMIAIGVLVLGAAAVTKGGSRPASQPTELSFHGHAARHRDPNELAHALLHADFDDRVELDRLAARLWNLARVLRRKRHLLRLGLCIVASGSALSALAIAIDRL